MKKMLNSLFRKIISEVVNRNLVEEIAHLSVKELKERYGRPIGRGSSREVYKLDNDTVIKRAVNSLGIKQNMREEDLYRFSESEMVTKVYAISDDDKIIISEYVQPLRKSSFSKMEKDQLGIKEVKGKLAGVSSQIMDFTVVTGEQWDFLNDWDFKGLVFLEGGGYGYSGDFVRPSSYGKRKDGTLVLLDFGYH